MEREKSTKKNATQKTNQEAGFEARPGLPWEVFAPAVVQQMPSAAPL